METRHWSRRTNIWTCFVDCLKEVNNQINRRTLSNSFRPPTIQNGWVRQTSVFSSRSIFKESKEQFHRSINKIFSRKRDYITLLLVIGREKNQSHSTMDFFHPFRSGHRVWLEFSNAESKKKPLSAIDLLQKKGTHFSSNHANRAPKVQALIVATLGKRIRELSHLLNQSFSSETIDTDSLTFSEMSRTYAKRFSSMSASARRWSSLNDSSPRKMERTEGGMVNKKSREQYWPALMTAAEHRQRRTHFCFPSEILWCIQLRVWECWSAID